MVESEIVKTFSWVMGHRLAFHKIGCSNIHGHNYTAKVTVRGEIDESTGFVMDFKDLKKAVMPLIDEMDHSFMYHMSDRLMCDIFKENPELKSIQMTVQPTAENIARYIFDKIKDDIPVIRVKVYETATCCAQYRGK